MTFLDHLYKFMLTTGYLRQLLESKHYALCGVDY